MTDKELRKLSRLELLELLLEASKENEKLKEKIDRLNDEKRTNRNIESLSVMTRQVEHALKYANSLTESLKTASKQATVQNEKSTVKPKQRSVSSDAQTDKEIYRSMLRFFAENDDKLEVFPDDLENIVRNRIKSILEKRSKK